MLLLLIIIICSLICSIRIKCLLALRISELGKLDCAPKTTTFDPVVMKTTTVLISHITIKFLVKVCLLDH